MRQRILTLLQDHPEGLSAEEIRVYLKAEKPIGDTLQGMRRNGVVTAQGQGRDMRYFRGTKACMAHDGPAGGTSDKRQ